jgi:hypothetical protein
MTHYLVPLFAVVLLCAGWAVFQVWLSRHDPEANQRLRKCGDCDCDSDTRCASDPG